MLATKLTFLFGANPPADADLDDPDVLADCVRALLPEDAADGELTAVLRTAIAYQVVHDDPPLVWETAQRLLASGLDREDALRQLALAFLPSVQTALDPGSDEVWAESYAAFLQELPVPSGQDIERTVAALLELGGPIPIAELDAAVLAELGVTTTSGVMQQLLDTVMDQLLDDGEIALLPGDLVVRPEVLCRGAVLTTRMASPPQWPPLDTDFAGFDFFDEPIGDPPPDARPGRLVMARHGPGGIVVEPIAEVPISAEEIAEVRRAYEAELAGAGLPISFEDLLLNLLSADRSAFDEPRAPLSELVTAAGLQVRGHRIAGDESVWRAGARVRTLARIADRADGKRQEEDAFDVYGVFDAVTGDEPDPSVTTTDLRRVLDLMADHHVLSIVTDEFFGNQDDPACLEATAAFARRLTAAASRPRQRAVAAWLMALVAERRCDPLAAAEALADAVRHAPDFLPAVDRLAWTRSDQGRADEATALWRQLAVPENPDLIEIEEATATRANPAAAGLRRNEPCWCGSGRKYKACHLRVTDLPPLPDRFGWMLRKTIGYLERRGDPVHDVIGEAGWKLADAQPEKFDKSVFDPLVLDLVLLELGWFARFLTERGPLLPEDEQLLFASWLLVPRTLYEIIDIRRDEGLTLRDLRTGDVVEVEEHIFSLEAYEGQVICARALPDGRSHKFGAALFGVPPGHEEMLIDILDDPDPACIADELLRYRAAASRPPSLATTEGEPLRRCELVMEVADPARTREILDLSYVSDEPGQWHQAHTVDDRSIIRAMMRLEGATLTVQTMSEARMDRVSQELTDCLPGARIISDVREDLPLPTGPASMPAAGGAALPAIPPEAKAALASWMEQQEQRWCVEPVPALGGLTPEEAAADPTHRERVIRLIDSFGPDGGVTDEGIMTMRPDRLRERLGIGVE